MKKTKNENVNLKTVTDQGDSKTMKRYLITTDRTLRQVCEYAVKAHSPEEAEELFENGEAEELFSNTKNIDEDVVRVYLPEASPSAPGT